MKSIIPWRNKRGTDSGDVALAPISRFRNEFDRLFDRFFRDPWSLAEDWTERGAGWLPSLDVSETDTEITVRAEVPGVKPDDLDVSVTGNVLTLSGEKKSTSESKDENSFHSECFYGSFRRSVTLPTEVDPEKIDARHAQGVLTIRMKKRHPTAARRVKVVSSDK